MTDDGSRTPATPDRDPRVRGQEVEAQRLAAAIGDRLERLAQEDLGRPDDLWEPVPADRRADGGFDDRAHGRSLQRRLAVEPCSNASPGAVRACFPRLVPDHD